MRESVGLLFILIITKVSDSLFVVILIVILRGSKWVKLIATSFIT